MTRELLNLACLTFFTLRAGDSTLTKAETMRAKSKSAASGAHFKSIQQGDVPTGREGKHKQIVSRLLSDLEQLTAGRALKIPLADLPDSKENIRSALNRATRQRGMDVATSSDANHLYVWNSERKSQSAG